jgi:hypothetical protein
MISCEDYHKAQATYDAQMPPESCEDEGHDWVYKGSAPDGTQFWRCARCKEWSE